MFILNRESFWALLFIERGKRSLQLIIFWQSDFCRLRINIKHDSHSSRNWWQRSGCLQRIVIRNRWFSKRVEILWKFHPFTPCINDISIHSLSILAFGPLHLLVLPPIRLTPQHSTFCSYVPLRKVFPTTRPKVATTLYLAVCFHATHHCLRQSVLHSFIARLLIRRSTSWG